APLDRVARKAGHDLADVVAGAQELLLDLLAGLAAVAAASAGGRAARSRTGAAFAAFLVTGAARAGSAGAGDAGGLGAQGVDVLGRFETAAGGTACPRAGRSGWSATRGQVPAGAP